MCIFQTAALFFLPLCAYFFFIYIFVFSFSFLENFRYPIRFHRPSRIFNTDKDKFVVREMIFLLFSIRYMHVGKDRIYRDNHELLLLLLLALLLLLLVVMMMVVVMLLLHCCIEKSRLAISRSSHEANRILMKSATGVNSNTAASR